MHQFSAVKGKKVMVKFHQSDKLTSLTLRLGLREVTDSLNFLGEGGDTMTVDVMSEEVQVRDTKDALAGIDNDAMR